MDEEIGSERLHLALVGADLLLLLGQSHHKPSFNIDVH
jgi:hypothetical protein